MPTYEYRCPAGHEFERFYRKISDAAPGVTCPECGKVAERMMSAGGGFAFKGSGFYLTDYGKNAHRGSAPKSDSSGGDSATASSDSSSSSTEGSSSAKESAGSKDSVAGSKDSGSSPKEGPSKSADAKVPSAAKPAETKASSESKPPKSGGPKPSKDK